MAMTQPVRVRPRPGLVAARARLGLTQERAAADFGVSLTTWARWERGTQGIRPYYRARLAEFFAVTAHEVAKWIDGEDAEPYPWQSADLAHAPLAVTLKGVVELWRWDVDASRRRLLASLPFVPSSLGEWLLSWSLDPPYATRAGTGSGPSVGMEDVRRIDEDRKAFEQMDHQFGAGLVRPAVVEYLNGQVAPLLRGRYGDEVGGPLLVAAGALLELAGWQAYDLGRHGLAQTQLGQALRLAKAADAPLLATHVLRMLTRQAFDVAAPEWAVRLARAAGHACEEAKASPRVRAFQLAHEARATAQTVARTETRGLHACRRVRSLIGRAEDAFARAAPGDPDPPWAWSLTAAELHGEFGCAWRLIGEHDRAVRCHEQAVQGLAGKFPRSVQINTVHLAETAIGMGELDAAIGHARAAVPMARALSSRRIVGYLTHFDHTLAPYAAEPRVREWRDYLRNELLAAKSRDLSWV
jgi:transcriptional regulator with XRE-family HTH domain